MPFVVTAFVVNIALNVALTESVFVDQNGFCGNGDFLERLVICSASRCARRNDARISIAEYFSDSESCMKADANERKLVFNFRQMSKPHQMVMLNMSEQLLGAEEDMNAIDTPELEELLFADDQVAAGTNYDDFSARCKPCYVHTSPMVRRADYVFRVNGDSMEPDYPNGCCVLVKKDDGLMRFGDVGVFQADNSLYIKEYRKEGLHSINPAYETMRREDYGMIRAIGRVIGIMSADDFASKIEIAAFKKRR